MHPKVTLAFDEIDAAVFSGDCFLDQENLDTLMYYIERWKKESTNCCNCKNFEKEDSFTTCQSCSPIYKEFFELKDFSNEEN